MPDPVTHYVFGRQVLDHLPQYVRDLIDQDVFERALQGPDPWSTCGFFGAKRKKYAVRSSIMHKEKTGVYLLTLAELARQTGMREAFSLLVGTICHYCLDALTHPYIICKGGVYDGSMQTKAYNGGHVRMERAIDSWFIRMEYGKAPWHVCIPKKIMRTKQYPQCLRPVIDTVYEEVYGWEHAFDDLNAALRDERRFYALMQDPWGLVHYLLRPLSNGRVNYCVYSYYKRETADERLDYLNLQHTQWHHPFDVTIESKDSFFDLFERAKCNAVTMIETVYACMHDQRFQISMDAFGNLDYSTGFDCNDSRNLKKPECEPLVYGSKYWNIV